MLPCELEDCVAWQGAPAGLAGFFKDMDEIHRFLEGIRVFKGKRGLDFGNEA